jgi:CDP-glucose 4,6-dehydratase
LFQVAHVADGIASTIGDINDLPRLRSALQAHQPEVVFHLAAQSLVRASYQDPVGTYATNVLGTASLLEAVRETPSVRAVVVVTSDKCYENREWLWPYRENDRLGGSDPYSNSKACAELVVEAYRNSFFPLDRFVEHRVAVATARAGNVIGGGDWSADRLIADIVRAFVSGEALQIRNPEAVRPWQHVLEPLRGYLTLAQKLVEQGTEFSGAWNFGPNPGKEKPVKWIVERLASRWAELGGAPPRWQVDPGPHPHEAHMLKLDSSKAAERLGWRPALSLPEALDMTLDWYRAAQSGEDAREKCLAQIAGYLY